MQRRQGVKIGTFDELLNYCSHQDTCLSCIGGLWTFVRVCETENPQEVSPGVHTGSPIGAKWPDVSYSLMLNIVKAFSATGENDMKRVSLGALISLTMMFGAAVAHGAECQGVSFPEQVQSAGTTLKLNGLGLRQATLLKIDVYVAALYVAETSGDASTILAANSPRELILHFVRNVDHADLDKAWDEGFEHNAKSQLAALKERIETFKGMMPDMKTGQQLRLVYQPGAGVGVDVNGTARGTIAGDDFAHALLSIWLGSHPPNADLKAGLLGGNCE
jgi:hypothetical protein